MEASIISILGLGFILGIKHAVEPDHVIAVSTIASQTKKLSRSSLAGVFWGIGHTATLFLIGLIVLLLKEEISERLAMSLEFLVGVMLVYLGFTGMLTYRKLSGHMHSIDRSHWKSVAVGFIHGLAGSAAMVLLTMSTVHSIWQGLVYIIVFGAGTVIGMLLFTTVIGLPFVFTAGHSRFNRVLTQATGLISMTFGVYYMYNLGVTEGLFALWLQR
ncbi:HoxN/HupN/NixA family nickel/cobalt transporter [Paenibacillus silviterrae]|uniref:HoxN/HupN/NixA family nickel/cobalt transporter n=1 Tax=Paenibacillus silviterrae TaxID=3242194 RepID=UPI002542A250|nr:sulfite exporter TauE/SafE family protein [Paenibacillus chinjuensis]